MDYYKTLGIEKNASADEVKKAYRRLALEYHPDKNAGNAEAERKFKEINEAYQILGDEKKRAQYDQFGHDAFKQYQQQGGSTGSPYGYGWPGGVGQEGVHVDLGDIGMGDIFDMFFGTGFGRSAKKKKRLGHDLEAVVKLTFEEAAFGTEKKISLHKLSVCDNCSGNGAEPGTPIETCKNCGGDGEIRHVQQTILGNFVQRAQCPECLGEGKSPRNPCRVCDGKGRVKKSETIDIKIPAGIADGQTIRLAGYGDVGELGSSAGDLYVNIDVSTHDRFSRDGFNVSMDQQIPYTTAALGGTVDIQTIDGEVKLKIPAGTPSGKIFKLSTHGIPFLGKNGRGDQFVTVIISPPEKLSREERIILEQLREAEQKSNNKFKFF